MFLELHTLKNQKKDEYFAAVRSGLERDCKSMDQKNKFSGDAKQWIFSLFILTVSQEKKMK